MRQAALLLITTFSGLAAVPAPNLDTQIQIAQDGAAKLVLRNAGQSQTQAYAVRIKCATPQRARSNGQPTLQEWRLNPEQRHDPSPGGAYALACARSEFREQDALLSALPEQIKPGGSVEFSIPPGALVAQVGVLYIDGTEAGDSDALREIREIRAAVRSSIPFAEAAVRELSTAPDVNSAIQAVENWRATLGRGFAPLPHSEPALPPERSTQGRTALAVWNGRVFLLDKILESFRTVDATRGQQSVSEAIRRALDALEQADSHLSNPPIFM